MALAAAGQAQPPAPVDYYRDVRPILTVHCYRCHSADTAKGKLRLDVREAAFKGGGSGDLAIVKGKGAESLLVKLVSSKDPEERMPSKAPALSAAEIDVLRRWIDQGADWPDPTAVTHWAFKPPARPAVPAVKRSEWVRTPVDAFIARGHEARGLAPAPEAPRRVLVRRLTLDLTGLPPTPEEVEAFLADSSSDAVEKLVDRLLASPAYGERWGRHWLDLARFGETSGYEANALRTTAWRYRDYVIRSFNEDKPYDRFLREQLAGDELEPLSDEHLVATGFLAHGRLDNNQEDRAIQRNDHLIDITNAVANVVFGMQFGCAQCHDHKWDPITHEDYYRFMGFFVRGQVNHLLLKAPDEWKAYEKAFPKELQPTKDYLKLLQDGVRARLREEALKKLPPEAQTALSENKSPEQQALAKKVEKEQLTFTKEQLEKAASEDDRRLWKELEKKVQALEKRMPEKPQTWGFYSPATSPNRVDMVELKGFYPMKYEPDKLKQAKARLLKRGDPHQAGAELAPGWPAVFGPTTGEATTRGALAEWLTSPASPLTARVWVNFVWQQHFGRGLVPTPGDFGLRGAKPTHPELLDWLSTEFAREKWSTQRLHRLIVLSSTYRQASRPDAANAKVDPENRHLWRWTPRRLESEAVRDSLLAVSGELDRKMGGPSLDESPKPAKEGDPKPPLPSLVRRSLYYAQKRHELPEAQELFDGPGANETCARRYVSTVSLQSLYLLNNPFVFDRAKALAARAGSPEKAFPLALGRPATSSELEGARAVADGTERGLVLLCHALLNSNEFAYVE